MDKASSLLMLGIIVIVILPFIINAIIKKIKKNKLQNAFMNLTHELNLSDHEIIHRNYAIGIDRDTRKFAYLNSKSENPGIVINLAEFSNCKVITSERKIELSLQPGNNPKSELKLELYNNAGFTPTSDDIEIARKWAEMVNSTLV